MVVFCLETQKFLYRRSGLSRAVQMTEVFTGGLVVIGNQLFCWFVTYSLFYKNHIIFARTSMFLVFL